VPEARFRSRIKLASAGTVGSISSVIKAFIFDIGNVLLRFDFDLAIQRIRPLCTAPIVPEELEGVKNRLEEGQITRQAFVREVMGILGFRGGESEFESAWQEIFEENLVMTDVVRQLKGRFPLYLLSNTSDLHISYIFRQYPVFALFDDAVYSHEAGCMKPAPEIYRIAARKLGVKPEETVFIDDLGPNIETAAALGFRAIHYDFTRHDVFMERLALEGVEV
jgi:putative hydrolase of the HAD superfamily